MKRSVGSHHASPTRTTNNKNKKRTIKSARTREARPPRCRTGTSVRTQISWLSAGLLFPQRRAATEAATGLVDTDAMCLYILATAHIQPSLSLSSKKKKKKTKTKAFQPLLPCLPACGDAPQPWVLGSKAMFASWDRPWRVATIIIDGAANAHKHTRSHARTRSTRAGGGPRPSEVKQIDGTILHQD